MKSTGFTILLVYLTHGLLAQASQQTSYLQENLNALGALSGYNHNNVARTFDNRYQGMIGSPFLLPGWSPADVRTFEGKTYAKQDLKYDVYGQNLIWRRPAGDSIIIDSDPILEFSLMDYLRGRPRVFRKVSTDGKAEAKPHDEFYEILYDGKTLLLNKPEKTLVKASYQGAYSADRRFDELTDHNSYFLRKSQGELMKIKLNKKSVLEALADRKTELASFLKQSPEKLDLGKPEDIAKLLAYYDSL